MKLSDDWNMQVKELKLNNFMSDFATWVDILNVFKVFKE